MCYSAEVSLLTFGLGIGCSSLLVLHSTTPFHTLLGWFLGYVSLMQGIEYLLWKHPHCDSYHKRVSVMGMILNHSQPIVLALLTWLVYARQGMVLWLLVLLYTIVIVPYSLQYTSDLQCSTRQCGATDPHLVWNWNTMSQDTWVYLVFLATFVGVAWFGMPTQEGRLFSVAAVITYALSSAVYDRKVMGSLWCFWTAFVPFVLYVNHSLRQS